MNATVGGFIQEKSACDVPYLSISVGPFFCQEPYPVFLQTLIADLTKEYFTKSSINLLKASIDEKAYNQA